MRLQEEIIQRIQSENDALMLTNEISHRIKNNLQIIIALVGNEIQHDLTPAFHPAATRDRPLLSRRSAGEATVGFKPDRCFSSSAAKAAGVA
jgi:hypothetical protein